jgi:hypothetical protein
VDVWTLVWRTTPVDHTRFFFANKVESSLKGQEGIEMAAGEGRLELLSPLQDEILEVIRQPAKAAGLVMLGPN